MESSIKIGFVSVDKDDPKAGVKPVIHVLQVDSDDPRDQLLNIFIRSLGDGNSLIVENRGIDNNGRTYLDILSH